MQAIVVRKNKEDWIFDWDGNQYSMKTHYGNQYRLSLHGGAKVERLIDGKWSSDWKINDIVRPTQINFNVKE